MTVADLRQPPLGAIQGPQTGDNTTVLARVAVAHHDLLLWLRFPVPALPVLQASGYHRMTKIIVENIGRVFKIVYRLEQLHHLERAHHSAVPVLQQARVACQQVHRQQVLGAARHANDQRPDTVRAALAQVPRQHLQGFERCLCRPGRNTGRAGEGSRAAQLSLQQLPPAPG